MTSVSLTPLISKFCYSLLSQRLSPTMNHRSNGCSELSTGHFSWTEASFQFFLGGAKFFLLFFNATGLLKNWKKKQHFICSKLTLFIVSFFLFSIFSLFFLFFLFCFLFSFFSFSLGGGGDGPPALLNDASVLGPDTTRRKVGGNYFFRVF